MNENAFYKLGRRESAKEQKQGEGASERAQKRIATMRNQAATGAATFRLQWGASLCPEFTGRDNVTAGLNIRAAA
eukprot:115025-Pelagomonas_calceolata.AAC.1